jgi:mevalonate kinase
MSDAARRTTGVGRGNGKTVLLGEHAVVYGMPAIAAGISLGATARAERSEQHVIRIAEREARGGDGSELVRALQQTCASFGLGPHRVEVDVNLPLGSGLGGSAAIGVAVTRALLSLSGIVETRELVLSGAAAWESVFHGNASGVDAAAAYAGGCIWFTKEHGPEPLFVAVPLRLAVCLAGPPASTKQMVESVKTLGERRPDLLGKSLAGIESLVKNAKLCIEAGDVHGLGQLMNYNQMLLSGLFLSTAEIERACAVARDAGALGAKLTGAGGGGAVIALCEGSARPIEAAFRAAGFQAFSTEIGASLATEQGA